MNVGEAVAESQRVLRSVLEIAYADGAPAQHHRVIAAAGLQSEVVGDVLALLLRDLGAEGEAGPGDVAVCVDPDLEDSKAMLATYTFQPIPRLGASTRGQAGRQGVVSRIVS